VFVICVDNALSFDDNLALYSPTFWTKVAKESIAALDDDIAALAAAEVLRSIPLIDNDVESAADKLCR